MTQQIIAPLNKKHVITSISIAVAAIAFIGILTYGLTLDQSKVPPANLNKNANAFTADWVQGNEHLPEASGPSFTLENFKGRPIVLSK